MSEPRALYESMTPEGLQAIRHAFELDQAAHAARGESSAFCANRIELIDSVLAARTLAAIDDQPSDREEERR